MASNTELLEPNDALNGEAFACLCFSAESTRDDESARKTTADVPQMAVQIKCCALGKERRAYLPRGSRNKPKSCESSFPNWEAEKSTNAVHFESRLRLCGEDGLFKWRYVRVFMESNATRQCEPSCQ